MSVTCSQCGMQIPNFGNVCPFCQSPRDDVEAQAHGLGCASCLMAFAGVAWLIFQQIDKTLIGAAVGAIVGIVCVRRAPRFVLLAALFAVVGIPSIWVFFPDTFFRGMKANPAGGVVGKPQRVITVSETVRSKISIGMTVEQVTALVGNPPFGKYPVPDKATGKQHEEWSYDRVYVRFDDGKVVLVHGVIWSDEIQEKVKMGMTPEQVNAALNSPPDNVFVSDDRRTNWLYANSSIYFEDGRVVRVDIH